MAQFTTRVERSFIRNGSSLTEFSVPAVSESLARRNALLNARAKGKEGPEVIEVENVGGSGVPGRDLFIVTVESAR